MDASGELRRRVARLDEGSDDPRRADAHTDIERFIAVLELITDSGAASELPPVLAATADALVGRCRLLRRLDGVVPEIVTGPFRTMPQYWVATGKLNRIAPGGPTPSESYFVAVDDLDALPVATKPFGMGLFTSTGVLGDHGMWRTYLDLNRWSTLHPLPWHTWAVTPRRDAVVHEISSAAQWIDFVRAYPLRRGALIYPDWRSAARDIDAVHMTLRAIVAIQGLRFPVDPVDPGVVAASYWDVESTFWLRWCFSGVELVETIEG
jgi:hypothetical protein